ncbi:hypothetical protein V491_02740 [Pseudogymnoascus sp. VKM F-3775]|nr:hypothetical protein V491_02740 [Pseudogymnoascus sp. VKM F-3775]
MNSLGWSRREEASIDTSQHSGLLSSIKSLNPFGGDGYVQLPTTEGPGAPLPAPNRREEEEGFFALSRWDRILIFSGCNVGALACFVICFALFPVMALRPRKFAILWSLGSVLFLASWAVMMGPMTYGRHLISAQRLPFTAAYFGSIGLTLYFSLGHDFDALLRYHSAGLFALVSHKLLPYGLEWPAPCYYVWGEEGGGLGVWVSELVAMRRERVR